MFSNRGLRVTASRFFSTVKSVTSLEQLFTNPKIYNLLRLITYNDPASVHKPRFKKLLKGSIQMLSDEELKTVQHYSSAYTKQRLQMPPVLDARTTTDSDPNKVIAKDKLLQGLLPSNYKLVFTDISPGHGNRDRLIVVREPDGTLRYAEATERDRVNTIYYPTPGRQMRVPMMFQGQFLQAMLQRGQHQYILDRACIQFEPDNPQYIDICHCVYDHVHQNSWVPIHSHAASGEAQTNNPLRVLRHTRHYGPMALYLIAQLGNPGGLIYEALSCQHYARLGWILRLVVIVKPQCPFAVALREAELPLPPPQPVNEGASVDDLSTDDREHHLSSTERQNVLSYVQLFADREPLSDSQKRLLMQHVEACQQSLSTSEEQPQQEVG